MSHHLLQAVPCTISRGGPSTSCPNPPTPNCQGKPSIPSAFGMLQRSEQSVLGNTFPAQSPQLPVCCARASAQCGVGWGRSLQAAVRELERPKGNPQSRQRDSPSPANGVTNVERQKVHSLTHGAGENVGLESTPGRGGSRSSGPKLCPSAQGCQKRPDSLGQAARVAAVPGEPTCGKLSTFPSVPKHSSRGPPQKKMKTECTWTFQKPQSLAESGSA